MFLSRINLPLWVNTTYTLSKDSRLVLHLKWYQAHDTLHFPNAKLHIFSLSSASPPSDWFMALIPHACSRGPLKGSRSADYLLAASRTTYNIPDRLSCSPTLICLKKPGLILPQKYRVTIWTSKRGKGKPDILLLIHTKVKDSNATNVVDKCALSLYISHILDWSTGDLYQTKHDFPNR